MNHLYEFSPKREDDEQKTLLGYIPHGVDTNVYRPLREDEQPAFEEFKKTLFAGEEVGFAILYNNRNIMRKHPNSVLLAFKMFHDGLPPEQAKRVRMVFHTQPVDDAGTDLFALIRDFTGLPVIFSVARINSPELNMIYNACDATINMASNEGFGIATLESLSAGKMIIANVTGGLQDQMGFVDDEGNPLDEDIHFNVGWGSNHRGTYKYHGEWCVPLFPTNITMIGSPPTPYIYDDRCSYEDAAQAIRLIYDMSKEERTRKGMLGREFILNKQVGMFKEEMCRRFIVGINVAIERWKPRNQFGLYKA